MTVLQFKRKERPPLTEEEERFISAVRRAPTKAQKLILQRAPTATPGAARQQLIAAMLRSLFDDEGDPKIVPFPTKD